MNVFGDDFPYPILNLSETGQIAYANPASLPVLLEWDAERGEVVPSKIKEILSKVISLDIAQKIELWHGNLCLELLFSKSSRGGVNVFGADVTLQRAAQLELMQAHQQTKNQLQRLEEAELIGKYGGWEVSPDGGSVVLSSSLKRIFSPDGESNEAEAQEILEKIRKAHTTKNGELGETAEITYALRLRDRNVFFRSKARPGGKSGWVQDITELVHAQEQARLYQDVLDRAAIVILADHTGKVISVNEKFTQVSGYQRAEVVDQVLPKLGREIDFQRQLSAGPTVGESGDFRRQELCEISKDGHTYWVETTVVPIFDPDQSVRRYMAIEFDITKRKEIATALNEAYRSLSLAETLGSFGSYRVKAMDGELKVSEGFLKLLKLDVQQVVHFADFIKMIHEDDRVSFESAAEFLLRSGQSFVLTFRVRTSTGEIFWIRNHSQIIELDQQTWLGTLQDITEKIESENALAQATAKANAATQAKSEFLANISHEIRTPMNGILGMCELLLRSSVGSHQRTKLKTIQSCGLTLIEIINSVLDLSKLEAGKVELESTPLSLGGLIQEVFQLLEVRASEKKIQFKNSTGQLDQDWFLGDPVRIKQVLTNLIGNAIKFTSPGGSVEIYASTREIAPGHFEIYCQVQDNGAGIPLAAQSKLFESFTQADLSTTRKFGGTGLGLTISKSLCKLMGGDIGFYSSEGKGSTFFFTFKAQKADPQVSSAEGEFSAGQADFGRLRILLVEDNLVNQEVALGLLQVLGARAQIANNGRIACEMARSQAFDLIFMDYHMPEMDGLEATRHILGLEGSLNSKVKIVGLTASAMKEEVERCLAAGMHGFLPKPLLLSSLIQTMQMLFSEEANSEAAPVSRLVEAPPTPNSEFDWRHFDQHLGGLPLTRQQEIVRKYLEQEENRLADIQLAVKQGNSAALAASAHTFKGMVSHFTLGPARDLAQNLEIFGKNGDLSEAGMVLKDLESAARELKSALRLKFSLEI